jgi:prepilin-type N-terminal cleavage/methylation domain-containing protein
MDRLRKDDGFTMVEVLVAILIVSIGAMATFTLLSSATRNAQRAKATQVGLEYAEQEMERLRSMEWSQLALKSTPQHEGTALNPNYRVLNEKFALSREPLGNYQTLVHNGEPVWGEPEKTIEGGTVSPGPSPFTNGDVSGKVYRYIVWRNDEACGSACPGPQDYKQIVIAVRLDARGNEAGERGYFEVQSNFVDPEDSAKNDPAPGPGGKVVTAQQFFLTDTSCSAAGTTASPTIHQEITSNHLLHNTRGTCEAGQKTGSTPGAPDALMLGLPPDPDPEDPAIPAEYDYANDSYLDTSPDTGTGVQIKRDDTSGCHNPPTGTTYPESQIHRWVTDKMTEIFVMKEKVTLEFYTKSLNNHSAEARICVFLFKRHNETEDTPITNLETGAAYWTWWPEKNANWPQVWTKVRLTMKFTPTSYEIPANDRLGVAISVERGHTEDEALSFMYDHPNYPSRLEIDTSTPIGG